MNTSELEQILFAELGYAGKPGLVTDPNTLWANGRPIPDIDTALFLNHTPLAYFSRLSELDPDKIQQLHKNVWSQSKVPLLFVTLPHEIRVYNGYASPPLPGEVMDEPIRLLQQLTELSDYLKAQQQIHQLLVEYNQYERVYLETGAFWDTSDGRKIASQPRADKQLVEGMGQMRRLLTQKGLTNAVAYTLLGRSVFIRYLEDRGILSSAWIMRATNGQTDNYRDTLAQGRNITYRLFDQLNRRFNGDLFPVDEEAEKDVDKLHLDTLLSFLNRTNLETGQLSFWPYNFEYIPIELISHIYDTFIEDQRSAGAYYTPLLLADFILEETMGDEVVHPDMSVLDPACGSGIFLVGAYRRLVQAWRRRNGQPTAQDLSYLLRQNIFGVDKNPEAVRIAAFSLYLEILNHLTNEQVQDETFRFPSLQRKNLLPSDFFAQDVDEYFAGRKFDRIVGNLPWGKGTLTPQANEWLKKNSHQVGGRQIAPAFMLRSPIFCKADGEIALLAPSKSSILVTSKPHQEFRDHFFSTFHIRAIVNFSSMRHELFSNVVSPVTAIFYTPHAPQWNKKLIYGVPKPSLQSQHLKAIVLDTSEIKFLNRRDLLAQPSLWKIAQWGTPRDAALIERLRQIPTLRQQVDLRGLKMGEGIQINGGDENPAPWLEGMPLIPTDRLQNYFVDKRDFETITEKVFHRPRVPELTQPPLVLIHQSKCKAAFSDVPVAYRDKLSGIVGQGGQEWLLYWLMAYINSPLATYYHFLTSTSWAVERDTIIQWEYEAMPFLIPDRDDPKLQDILLHLDQIKSLLNTNQTFFDPQRHKKVEDHKTAIHKLVYELFDLHPVEQQLIEDMVTYGIGFFEWAKRKTRKPGEVLAVQKPNEELLKGYAETFIQTTAMFLQIKQQALKATVYKNGAPLTVITFELVDLDKVEPVQVITQPGEMRAKLRELDELLVARKTPSMYIRRHVRVYDGKQISLIRPSEQRFWTKSQARADADAFLADLFE